ncbi:MAG: hypothetical protein ABSF50_15495 [Burkholderiaceae bacterium]
MRRSRPLSYGSALRWRSLSWSYRIGIECAAATFLLVLCPLSVGQGVLAAQPAPWVPGASPDAIAIFHEAKEDLRHARYGSALAKLVWFYESAEKYQVSVRGVRLTYALNEWYELAKVYAPALPKMQEERDRAEERVREGIDAQDEFQNTRALNRRLGESDRTVELFAWLDQNRTETAKRVFDLAVPILVSQKQFPLCAHYLEPQTRAPTYVERYNEDLAYIRAERLIGNSAEVTDYAREQFVHDASTLVALLSILGRMQEADSTARYFEQYVDIPGLSVALNSALSGHIPERH